MTSMYNKLWKKQDELFLLLKEVVGHICMNEKKYQI
jgi:hypothetical protein